ncbi:MAG: lnt [Gammaproteobacteria bacterium]|jgi:apolipoprotein N-acyltransferase|nr:lnt [Gammaproteobacteria bacterium]
MSKRSFFTLTSSLLAGTILTLSFAPFYLWFLAPLSIACLFALWLTAKPWQAALRGFCFGIGFFGTAVSWVFVSIHHYGNTNAFIAIVITSAFVLLLSLAPAITAYLTIRYFPRLERLGSLLTLPGLWTLSECVRSYLFTGFPWVLLGQSQVNSPLRGFFPLMGIYGVSFLTAFIGTSLFLLFYKRSRAAKMLLLFAVLSIMLAGYALSLIQWTKSSDSPLSVSLIQGNVAQEDKWKPEQVERIINDYQRLSSPLWISSDLLIWPENAVPVLDIDAKPLLQRLQQRAIDSHNTLILGLPIAKEDQYYNGAIALNTEQRIYLKRHLVPFGEYLPLEKYLRGLIGFFSIPMSDLSAGEKEQAPIIVNKSRLSLFICYEIAYAQLVRNAVKGSNLIVELSDDSWFGRSIANSQQLQISQVRALETGRYVLSATNNGKTAIIDNQGKIIAAVPAYETAILQGHIQPMKGYTPWLIIGLWPIVVFCLLCLLIVLVYHHRLKNRVNSIS